MKCIRRLQGVVVHQSGMCHEASVHHVNGSNAYCGSWHPIAWGVVVTNSICFREGCQNISHTHNRVWGIWQLTEITPTPLSELRKSTELIRSLCLL